MATKKKRLSIALTDSIWDQLRAHRNRLESESSGLVVSVAEAAVDLFVKGLLADGIALSGLDRYEDLRRKVDQDIQIAEDLDDDPDDP
jgi:hypothetical protein